MIAARFYFTAIVLTVALHFVLAQEVQINLGNTQVALNEYFTITLTIQNEQLKGYSNFPDIQGFQKRGVSSQSSTNIVNGQVTFSQSVVQNYAPTKEGKFKLPDFTMEVNGKKVAVKGTTIVVGPAKQQQQYDDPFAYDPFADFFGRGAPKEYVDVKDDAFFALTSTKDKVYIGEGFTVTLAFYVGEANRAKMQFYDLANQINTLLKKIKPANCWIENFGIEEIQPEKVQINGKNYTEYKLYRATYFPLNKDPITFPELSLKMIKYKEAKVKSFFGFNNEKQDFKDFISKPKTITVRELPPHPLRDNVSVGVFKLEESVKDKKFTTGKSVNYSFKIVGEGNISAIKNPQQTDNPNFDVYPPNIYQDINRSGFAVTGAKNFNYFIIPKEPGHFAMKDLLYWIYFNTKTERYDTLKPKQVWQITGESSKNLAIQASDYNEFSYLIDAYHNNFVSTQSEQYIKWIANIFLGVIFLLTLAVIIKK